MSRAKGELALIEAFRHRARRTDAVLLGIGDDMAAVNFGGQQVLITADMLLDGVHFDRTRHTVRQIGRKAVACSLSDCAAMAAIPVAATVSFALDQRMSQEEATDLFEAMAEMGERYGCPIVGGDVTSWSHPLAIDVAMLARPDPRGGPVRRDGARVGDRVCVTGRLGGSLLGHHLDFTPRLAEAGGLLEMFGERLHAMIDVSDGLALDLHRLCQASGVGAVLEEAALEAVISDAARQAAEDDGRSPLDHALHDGEDFELLFCVALGDVERPAPADWFAVIGRTAEGGLTLGRADGTEIPLPPVGYEHFRT